MMILCRQNRLPEKREKEMKTVSECYWRGAAPDEWFVLDVSLWTPSFWRQTEVLPALCTFTVKGGGEIVELAGLAPADVGNHVAENFHAFYCGADGDCVCSAGLKVLRSSYCIGISDGAVKGFYVAFALNIEGVDGDAVFEFNVDGVVSNA